MPAGPLALYRARQPAHKLPLQDDEDDQNGDDGHDHAGRHAAQCRRRTRPAAPPAPPAASCASRVCSISDGQKKSFHELTKVKMAAVASDGRMTGITTCHQMRSSLAPSIRAASSRSLGTVLKACRSRKILNTVARLGKISASSVS